MKFYKIEQIEKQYTTDCKEVVNRINCRYFVDDYQKQEDNRESHLFR